MPAHRLSVHTQKRRHAAPNLHGFGSELSGCWWTELQRPSNFPRGLTAPQGAAETWLAPALELWGQQA